MPDREYTIKYVVDDSAAIRGLDAIAAKVAQLDRAIDAAGAKLRDLPKQLKSSDMTQAASQMYTALGQVEKQASAAKATVAGVGTDTSKMVAATAKAEALASRLGSVTSNAVSATAAMGGMGMGMGMGRGGAGGGGGGVLANIGMGVARRTAFSGLRAGFNAVGQGAEARKDYFETATKRFNDFRSELQEIANLTKQPTVNDKVINEQLDFQRQTGMTADEAINFREQYLGAIGAAKLRGNITDDVAKDMGVSAAQFGLRYNLDSASTGKLAGLLGEFGKIPTADAGAAKLAETAYHLNVLGVGQVKSMIPAMIGLQGEMVDENGGRFSSIENLAGRFAASTIRSRSPATAATQIRQANTALRRFDREDVEGATGYALKAAGITAEDDYESALRKLTASGKLTGPDADQWLMRNGFANQAERRSLIAQAKLTPVVDAQLGKTDPAQAAAIAKVRADASAANAGYLGTDMGRQRLAEAGAFATEINFGARQTRFERARTEAETRRRQRREIDTPAYAAAEAALSVSNLGMMSGRDYSIDTEVYSDIMRRNNVTQEQITAKFPKFGEIYGSVWDPRGRIATNPEQRAQLFEQVSAEFDKQAAGGNGGPGAKLQQAAQLLQQAGQQLNQPKPAPKPGQPPAGFVGGRP